MHEDYDVDVRGPILDRLGHEDSRVMTVSRLKNGNFRVMEACDQYFWEELTPEELAALGAELIAAAAQR